MTKTREVLLKLTVTEGEAALFEKGNAMVVPLSDAEVLRLGQSINTVTDMTQIVFKSLATLLQIVETRDAPDEQLSEIVRTLRQVLETAQGAYEMQEHVKSLIGRAIFIGQDSKKEPLQ